MEKAASNKPISIEDLSQIRRLNDVKFSRDGNTLFWVESIDGKGEIRQLNQTGRTASVSGNMDVRGSVGYGGGEFDVGAKKLVFTDRSGGLHLVRLDHSGEIETITSGLGEAASPVISPDENLILYVYQQDQLNGLAIVSASAASQPTQLAVEADFYMQPAWHPSGEMIAWSEWNHPNMPWDASCVKIGKVSGQQLHLIDEQQIAGRTGAAASQPRFSPDGKWLSYIQREGNWDNLILFNLEEERKHTLITGDNFHLCLPNWVQGMRSYSWNADGRYIYYFRYMRGQTTLWQIDPSTEENIQLDISPVSWATQIDSPAAGRGLAFLGTSPRQPKQIWHLTDKQFSTVVKNEFSAVAKNAFSEPQEITFQSAGQIKVYGIYFPPAGQTTDESAPPLILDIHGGPTAQDYIGFSPEAAYFTSRGYAYAQINYRGSSGYGYPYQDALKHSWGVVDVEDTLNFAQELVQRGLAHPDKLVLKGSSAGGFTALNALIHQPGIFRAAICSFAVVNLVDDAQNTHKFERFYHRFLTGNLEKDYHRFVERSPIFHIVDIHDPIALFHGDSDKVVSPSQSIEIYKKLSERGVPCTLKIYEGEGHGFRKVETLKDYYQRIEEFLKTHLLSV